jgi:hypothetical protein
LGIEGVSIILDKSSLQMLNQSEIEALCRHYYLVLPPILTTEILGDLHAGDDDARRKVQILANKVRTHSVCKHLDYRIIRDESLLGTEVPASFRPCIQPTYIHDDADGAVAFISESIEMKDIHDWQGALFSEQDLTDARSWKELSVADLDQYRRELIPIAAFQQLSTLREIFAKMNLLYHTCHDPWTFINWYCDRIGLQADTKRAIQARWIKSPTSFPKFAPYAYYCFLIEQVFFQGLAKGLVPTSANAKAYVDLQYAFYFPYARMFSSEDRFHNQLWEAFGDQEQQIFVKGSALKGDLRALQDHWEAAPEEARNELRRIAPHPPALPGSVTLAAYERMIALGVRTLPNRIEHSPRSTDETSATVNRILEKYHEIRSKIENSDS